VAKKTVLAALADRGRTPEITADDLLSRIAPATDPRNLPVVQPAPALPVPTLPAVRRLGGDVAIPVAPQRARFPHDDATRAIVGGFCAAEVREWWAVFRLNPHNRRFYMEAVRATEPTDLRAAAFKVADLHVAGVGCPVCARPLVVSSCAYQPPLSCRPSECPGICRTLTIEGG
jgi:hypothetical protein